MFSVVIPLFNKAGTIRRALDSVRSQTVAPDEIVVVNDGSTDGGAEIARSLGEARLRVIDQPNRGVSAARNAGLRAAVAPLVAFLDADDKWQPGFLSRIREMVNGYPGAELYATGFRTEAAGQKTRAYGVRRRDLPGAADCRGAAFGPVNLFDAWRRGPILHPSSMVVSKAAALAAGGFPEGVSIGEDFIFWCRLALAGPVILAPDVLAVHDVGVPGQLSEFWATEYRRTLDVLEYHRFLAETLRRGQVGAAFRRHVRRELRLALFQRVYRGRFDALEQFWRELELDRERLGAAAGCCGWLARHRAVQPVVGAAMRVARRVRGTRQRGGSDGADD